ncbi:hypothetical protein HZB90_04045 [archaeon]|nr:hypothetical protein [archaeon]
MLVLRKRKGKQKKEEKKAKEAITIDKKEYRRKKEEKKTSIWPILITIIILAALGAAAYYSFTSGLIGGEKNETEAPEMAEETPAEITETEPVVTETEPTEPVETETPAPEETETGVLTNEDITESLITLDRSAIAGEGNVLRITNETELNLPMSIKNPTDRKARFEVGTQEGSWVTFDRDKVTVMPNSTETMNVNIVPDLAALEDNDYEIKLNTTLEGKKISYQEELDIVVTKQKSTMGSIISYWPWLVVGLMVLIILLILIKLVTREKTQQIREIKPAKKEKAEKKPKEERPRKEEGEGTSWTSVFIALIVLLIVAGVAFWAFNTFIQPEQATNETQEATEVVEMPVEPQEPVAAENVTLTEPKLTEADVEESLVTIDRSAISGEGNVLELEQDQYVLPMSIKNPTDRKARFTVSTSNESWIVFDEYKIIVQPESTKTVDMNIIPDKEALKSNDYSVTINTKLEGQKIDYEEQIGFVLKDKTRFEMSYLAYALMGLVLIGIFILITEIVKRANKHPPAVKTAKKTERKEKDLADINKEITELRKKTILQLRKSSH